MVTWLLAINTALFFTMAIMGMSSPASVREMIRWFGLIPSAVVQGKIWQIVTYSVLHGGFVHWFFNMLALWMFGPSIEGTRGSRYFLELFLSGVIGGALFSIGLAYSGVLGNPNIPTVGASAGIYAVLMAFGIFFAENEIILIPLPIQVKAKYFVAILIVVTLAFSLQESNGVAEIAHLGGLVFGFLFVKFMPARGLGFELSESYFVVRNFFHRWKRRRASKKFQVYMRKHNQDPKDYFDEYGNFRPPDEKDKKNGGSKGGWVN